MPAGRVAIGLVFIIEYGYCAGVGQLPVKEVWLMEQFLYDVLAGTLAAVIAALVIRLIDN